MSRRLLALAASLALIAALLGAAAVSRAGSSPSKTISITVVGPTVSSANTDRSSAYCPKGWVATGGGVEVSSSNLVVTVSAPIIGGRGPLNISPGRHGAATGWFGYVRRDSHAAVSYLFDVSVVCVR
jgi:hypothetical protein